MGNICLVWWYCLSSEMGIMQFESWQAMRFGTPVLGRRGRREEVLSALPGSSVWNASSKVKKPMSAIFCLSIFWFNSIQLIEHLLCTECWVLCLGLRSIRKWTRTALQNFSSSGGTGKSIDNSKIQARKRPSGDSVVELWARVNSTEKAGKCLRKDAICLKGWIRLHQPKGGEDTTEKEMT